MFVIPFSPCTGFDMTTLSMMMQGQQLSAPQFMVHDAFSNQELEMNIFNSCLLGDAVSSTFSCPHNPQQGFKTIKFLHNLRFHPLFDIGGHGCVRGFPQYAPRRVPYEQLRRSAHLPEHGGTYILRSPF